MSVKTFTIPRYPPLARQGRVQGDLSALVHIRADGTVESVSDVQGPGLLSDEAVAAMRSWTFSAADKHERQLKITFRYVLQGKEARECFVHQISGQLPGFIQITTNPTEGPGPD